MFQDQEEFQQILNYRPIWHDVLSRLTSTNPPKPSASLVQEVSSNTSNSLVQEVSPNPPVVSNSLIQEVDAPAPSASLIEEVNPNLHTGKLLITVVDSQDTSSLEQSLGNYPIILSMPNILTL
jgi:pyrroline-5-carboxylate reductase